MVLKNNFVSESTIRILRDLLREAEKGMLIGLAFISICRGRRPDFGWSGYAEQAPYFTLGAIQRLNEMMMEKTKKKVY